MEISCVREGILLGMGNPLLDISAVVDEKFLEKYEMKANDAILATDKHKTLCSDLLQKYNAEFIAGGSVQNTLRVAQWFLEKPNATTFFGCVGDDKYSKLLEDKARSTGVNVQYQYHDSERTGTCAVLITGTHRSLCADLAAANCFTIDHIQKSENKKLLDLAQFYYISGFFITVSPASIMEVAKHALERNRPLIMNLSAPFIPRTFKEPLMAVFPYIDILFGNETEAEAFSKEQNLGTDDLKEIALKICNLPKQNEFRQRIVILTNGSKPVTFAHKGKCTEYPVTVLPEDKVVDTNGAGDAFAGGFLAQLVLGQSYETCIKCGIWAATQILQTSGCTFSGKADFQA